MGTSYNIKKQKEINSTLSFLKISIEWLKSFMYEEIKNNDGVFSNKLMVSCNWADTMINELDEFYIKIPYNKKFAEYVVDKIKLEAKKHELDVDKIEREFSRVQANIIKNIVAIEIGFAVLSENKKQLELDYKIKKYNILEKNVKFITNWLHKEILDEN